MFSASFDGLRGIRVYADSGDQYVWTGRNHTVNIMDADNREYDVMSVGDFAADAATLDEVMGAVRCREAELSDLDRARLIDASS